MQTFWKIVIVVLLAALIGFAIYRAIPRQATEPETPVEEEQPQLESEQITPAIPPPGMVQPGGIPGPREEALPPGEVFAGGEPVTGEEIQRRVVPPGEGLPGYRPEEMLKQTPEGRIIPPIEGGDGRTSIPAGKPPERVMGDGTLPVTGEGDKGISASPPTTSIEIPTDVITDSAGPASSGPESAVLIPPVEEEVWDPEMVGPPPPEVEAKAREGKRFILPPIIGNAFLDTVIGDRKFTLVYADQINKDKQKQITELHGNVRIQYKDNVIESQEAIFNDDEEWARFFGEGGVFAKNDDGELRCDELEAHFDTKIAYLTGSVDIIRYANTEEELEPLPDDATRREKIERALKKKQTHITCTDGEYDWGNKIGDLHKGVHIEQEDKYVDCDELHFERETEEGLLTGNVVLHQDNGRWLFDENIVTDEDKKVMQVLAREETTAYSDELEFKGDEDWLQMRDNVHGVQPDKEGKCKTLTLDDSEDVRLLTLDKDVWLHQENGDWLIKGEVIDEDESEELKEDVRKWATLVCDKLLVHTDTEDAEASGGVSIEQEHQNGKADLAFYIREYDMIRLEGNVEVHREDKNSVFANEAFLFMSSRIFEARGDVRSTAFVDVEEQRNKRDEGEEPAGG